MRRTTTLMAGFGLALLACTPSGFNTPTLLNKPRILAIQAEPPQPALGTSTTLRPLVYLPPPSADAGAVSVTGYSWSWCPLATSSSNDYACPIGQDAGDSSLPGLPSLDLGTGETATFTNPFPASVLGALCNGNLDAVPGLAALAASTRGAAGGNLFNCTIAGFPITIKLVVHTSAGEDGGDSPLPAVFTVYLPINDAIAPNANPMVGNVYVLADSPGYQLDEAGTQQLVRDSTVPLVLDMPLSDSEILPDPNQVLPSIDPNHPNSLLGPNDTPDPNLPPRERLHVDWYAEAGDFTQKNGVGGETSTGYLGGDPNDPISPFTSSQQNFWNIPGDYKASSARVIVVVRDSRGGVTWTSGVATVLPGPPDAGASDAPQADSGEVALAPDAGAPDAPQADSGEVVTAPDAGASDLPQADAGELIPDAGVPDAAQAGSVDALLEIAP